jgi:hypothetical protein
MGRVDLGVNDGRIDAGVTEHIGNLLDRNCLVHHPRCGAMAKQVGAMIRCMDSHKALQHVQPVPILIIASEGDFRMGPGVAQTLYAEARSPMKKLEVFGKEVTHGAAARIHPQAYSILLLNFLDKALQEGADADEDEFNKIGGVESFPR